MINAVFIAIVLFAHLDSVCICEEATFILNAVSFKGALQFVVQYAPWEKIYDQSSEAANLQILQELLMRA